MAEFIAFYLPQYHPIPENDEWYGKGFTEWTNVAKAKPLFRGHYQPHVPADLGFYDLRLRDVRVAQAQMAQKYGIACFCYWTYWFGGGKTLLDMPIWEVHKDNEISLPFCLAWANHSWEKKKWKADESNEMIVEQKYLGESDYKAFFYHFLALFRDNRYYRVDGKLLFVIYDVLADESLKEFISIMRSLAKQENLGDFYFVTRDDDCRSKEKIFTTGVDAIYDNNILNIHHNLGLLSKVLLYIKRDILGQPTVFSYKKAIDYMISDDVYQENIIPLIAPNWDHSPRSGGRAMILKDCEPKYFYKLCVRALKCVRNKKEAHRIIFIQAWNEWGEGNHMEPDLKYGKGYLEALKKAIEEERSNDY